jgi:2-polyprenyl-3-methyl-5-hydroxy-6-metoxy-1,4-benzoquinol methylase
VSLGTDGETQHFPVHRRLLNVSLYSLFVTATGDRAALRDRLYGAYVSQHVGHESGNAAALSYRRDIRPFLPPQSAGPVVDIGCGSGQLVRLLLADDYDAEGIDVSPEQVALAHRGDLHQVKLGDYRDLLAARPGQLAAVTATDLLEHLAKPEVLDTLDLAVAALLPGGVFVARVPNSVSPFGGNIRYGDFTHELSFTARSVRQLAAAAGFSSVAVRPCPPVAHGFKSALRVTVWKAVSTGYKVALAAETGATSGHIVTQNLAFVARKLP